MVPDAFVKVHRFLIGLEPLLKEVRLRRDAAHALQISLLEGLLVLDDVCHFVHQYSVLPFNLLVTLLLQQDGLWLDFQVRELPRRGLVDSFGHREDAVPVFVLHLLVPFALEDLVEGDLSCL